MRNSFRNSSIIYRDNILPFKPQNELDLEGGNCFESLVSRILVDLELLESEAELKALNDLKSDQLAEANLKSVSSSLKLGKNALFWITFNYCEQYVASSRGNQNIFQIYLEKLRAALLKSHLKTEYLKIVWFCPNGFFVGHLLGLDAEILINQNKMAAAPGLIIVAAQVNGSAEPLGFLLKDTLEELSKENDSLFTIKELTLLSTFSPPPLDN
ncbi:MAG: hypothetical protein LBV23_04175 [Deltaproteobacteria bacterium]|nr:hypothetical protein [Deltaproteobacteria bacterium]